MAEGERLGLRGQGDPRAPPARRGVERVDRGVAVDGDPDRAAAGRHGHRATSDDRRRPARLEGRLVDEPDAPFVLAGHEHRAAGDRDAVRPPADAHGAGELRSGGRGVRARPAGRRGSGGTASAEERDRARCDTERGGQHRDHEPPAPHRRRGPGEPGGRGGTLGRGVVRRRGADTDGALAPGRVTISDRRERGAAEVTGRRVAVVGALGERARDHVVERGRHLRGVVTSARGRLGQLRPQLRLVALARERRAAGEREVEDAAERVDVGPCVEPLAADLLRGHVVDRADPVARARLAVDRERVLGEPEVGQVHVVRGTEQDVGGLDVAMDEPGAVGGVERRAELGDHAGRAGRLEGAALAHQRAQVPALDVTHRDVRDPVLLARVVDGDDVRMVDRRRELATRAGSAVASRRPRPARARSA